MHDFWSASFFFPSNLVGRIYFFLSSFLCRIFFLKKVSCLHLQNVFTFYNAVIAVIVLIWSCKALKCGKLYKIILV